MAVKCEPVDLEFGEEAPLDMSQPNSEVLNLIIRPQPQPEGSQKTRPEPDRTCFLSPPDSLGPVFVSSVSDLLRDAPPSSRESVTSSVGGTLSVEHFLSTHEGRSEAHKPVPRPSGSSDDGDVLFLYSQHPLQQDKRDIEFETYIIARDEEEVNSKCLPKKYRCRFCVYKTSYKSDLNRHLRKHGSSVYHCSLCKMPFRTVGNLENHRRLAHACTGAGIYDLGVDPLLSLAGPPNGKRDEPGQSRGRAERQSSEFVQAAPPNLFSLVTTSPTSSIFAAVAAAAQLRQPPSSLLLPHSPHLLSAAATEANGLHLGSPSSLDCLPLLSCRVCGFMCTDSSVYRQHQHSHHQVFISGLQDDGCSTDPKPRNTSLRLNSSAHHLHQRQTSQNRSLQTKFSKNRVVAARGGVETKQGRGEIRSSMSAPGDFSEGQTRIVRLAASGMSLPHVPAIQVEAGGKPCREDVRWSSVRRDNDASEGLIVTSASSPSPCIVIEDELLTEDQSKDSIVPKDGSMSIISSSEGTQIMQTAYPIPPNNSPEKEGSSCILNQQLPALASGCSRSAPSIKEFLNQKRQLPIRPPQADETTSSVRPSHDHGLSQPSQPVHAIDQTDTEGVSFALAYNPESRSFNTTAAASTQRKTVEKRLGEVGKGNRLPVSCCEREKSNVGDKKEAVVEKMFAMKSAHLCTYAVGDKTNVEVEEEVEEEAVTKRDQEMEELDRYVKEEPESPWGKENMADDSSARDEADLDTGSQNGDQEMRQDSLTSLHTPENSLRYVDNLARSTVEDGQNREGFADGRGGSEPLTLYVSSSLARLNVTCDSDESKQGHCRRCGEMMSVAEMAGHSRECCSDAGGLPGRDSGLTFPSTSSVHHHAMQSGSASYVESCGVCAHQFVAKCFLLKHMQKCHPKVFAQLTSLPNTDVDRHTTLPVSHLNNSVFFTQNGGPSARTRLLRKGHSAEMYQDHQGFDDRGRARRSFTRNQPRSQDIHRQFLSKADSVPGKHRSQVRSETMLDSPTGLVFQCNARAASSDQAEVLSQPPQTGRFARLVSDFDDFAARPYACALCFFRTSRLWDLQAHSQNHLTGCSTAPIPESARFYISPAFLTDHASSSFSPHFTAYEAEAVDENPSTGDAVERPANCPEEASGPRTNDVSLGRLRETTINLEDSAFNEYSSVCQLQTNRILLNAKITDNLSRSSARKSKHLYENDRYRSSASVCRTLGEEKKSRFRMIVSRNPHGKKGFKPNISSSKLSKKRLHGYARFSGQRSSQVLVNQSADAVPSVHGDERVQSTEETGVKKYLATPCRVDVLGSRNNGQMASLAKAFVPDSDASNVAVRPKTNNFRVQYFGEGRLFETPNRNHLCAKTRACTIDPDSLPPAAAGESNPFQMQAATLCNRQRSLKRKKTNLCRFKSKRTTEVLRMRRSLHACRDCGKEFTFRQLLVRHVKTFHWQG